MNRSRWIVPIAVAVFAAIFARLNSGEAITIRLGVHTFYRVPLVPFVLGMFLLGMATMFLLGLNHDRKVRRVLRERLPLERERAVPTGLPAD